MGADASRRRTLFCDLLKNAIYLLKMPPTAITLAVPDVNVTYTQTPDYVNLNANNK